MLRSLDALEKGFRKTSRKSREGCGEKLEEMRKLTFLSGSFFTSYYKCYKQHQSKYGAWGSSLNHACLLELFRISAHIVFLSCNGLYRNAFDDIRYALESIVQATYIDHEHPETPFSTKMEILKEIEGQRDYRAKPLIEKKLKLGTHKQRLNKEYEELSRKIHPSHRHIEALLKDIKVDEKGIPTTVSCEEISSIYNSMTKLYDIIFFLAVKDFPELKESLRKNPEFTKHINAYNLHLLNLSLRNSKQQ